MIAGVKKQLANLATDFRQLLGAEQQEPDHQNDENFAGAQSEHVAFQ